jgi:hypothetical protein
MSSQEERVAKLAQESLELIKAYYAKAQPGSLKEIEALEALAIVVSKLLHEAGDGRVDEFFHAALKQQYLANRVIKREVD